MSESQNNLELAKKAADLIYQYFEGQKKTHSEVLDSAEFAMRWLKISKTDANYNSILSRAIDLYEMEVGIKTFNPYVIAKDKKTNLWLYKRKDTTSHAFFNRYKMYLRKEGFAHKAIENIEQTCEKVLAYCTDPMGVPDKKKGLVVGDVQSGKTANYLGLINMAFDYGYRIVVLLAGMTDSLRVQTQKRMDQGVIGAISDSIGNTIEYCGVGLTNHDHYAVPFTNRENDFAKFIQKNLNATINDFKKPVVLVVKKNKRILESVMARLRPALQQYGSNSILVIDDEADNASISTAKPGKDPTSINRCIRDIFNSFPFSSYVGFTATPFANIFINPDEEFENMNLFPSDFIVQLNAPDNYFGGRKVFSGETESARPIRLIYENEYNFLPVVHHKDDYYMGLTDSIKEAIHAFLINNVVRTLRGHRTKHRSMMINISRFNNMHRHIRDSVTEYIAELRNIIEQDSGYPVERFIKNDEMRKIYELFEFDEFYDAIREGNQEEDFAPISWEEIQQGLYDEIKQVQTVIINKNSKFDYGKYDKEGARIIAIGGFVLSRGLTLEGLMVSYYSRNAVAYDTLLQMCRWFGYRPKYQDLCMVYMTQVNVDNFNAVLDAVEDLKEQFAEMDRKDKKPIDYGLMVRESPDTLHTTLMVTSRNKLQYTDEIVYHLNYGGVYADTSKMPKDPEINIHNLRAFKKFYDATPFSIVDDRFMARQVSKFEVADFVRNLKISYVNRKFDTEGLAEYIENSDVYYHWDVVIATGDSDRFDGRYGINWKAPTRSFHIDESEPFIRIGGSNNRVLDPGIFNAGLTQAEKDKIAEEKGKGVTLSATAYLKHRNDPILIVYPLDLKTDATAKEKSKMPGQVATIEAKKMEIKNAFGDNPLIAFAVGFPDKESKVRFNYRVNKVKIAELNRGLEVDNGDEEDEDEI